MLSTSKPRLLLALPQGTESYEAAAFIDVFGWNSICGQIDCSLVTCALDAEVQLSFGRTMQAQSHPADLNLADFQALALPGGFGRFGYFSSARAPEFQRIYRHFIGQNKPVAAICTAVIPLAESGLLAKRRVTCYNQEPGWREQVERHKAIFVCEPLVQDGNLITAQNPAAAIQAALTLLQLLTGPTNQAQIAQIMGFSPLHQS